LAHQISIPSQYWQSLEDFVSKGGHLIVDGLTAYYDENALCLMKTGFPLEKLFGGNISEYKLIGNLFDININKLGLKAHLWQGSIKTTTTAKPIAFSNGSVVAIENKFGKGKVVWVPSLLGLGARIDHDYSKLSEFLKNAAEGSICTVPIRFQDSKPGMLMKLLKSGDSYVSILLNKSTSTQDVEMIFANREGLHPVLIYADKQGKVSGKKVKIFPEETMVIQWN
jgi:beta-galactosidase